MKMAQAYVPIYLDWMEVTGELSDNEKGRLIDAMVLFALGGDWQSRIKGNERYLFPAYKRQIERAKELSGIRTATGSKGGRPKQEKPNETKINQTEPNESKSPKKEKEKEEEDKEEYKRECVREKRPRFSPPTEDKVRAYCQENGYQISPERFVCYYASKGWVVGKAPMKDWKAAVRQWAARDKPERKTPIYSGDSEYGGDL